MASKLTWKPVRSGKTYCSSACGARCTWAAYQRACKAADALCRQLGPTWKPRVWENLDWHFQAYYKDVLQVSPSGLSGSLWTAQMYGRWMMQGKTPQLAVARVIIAFAEGYKA